MPLPRISIITPSFNQAAFLGATVDSVLSQHYPNLEFIIIDGGSSDSSEEIIRRNSSHLAYWVSEKDRGQTHAINKGLDRCTGDIVAYVNSDDLLLPGALQAVAVFFESHPEVAWVTGGCIWFQDLLTYYQPKLPGERWRWLLSCPVAQPATFWRRSLLERFGMFDESFHYCMDFEYWIRLRLGGVECVPIIQPLAAFRVHGQSKTVSQQARFREEEQRIRETYQEKLSLSERSRLRRRFARMEGEALLANAGSLAAKGEQSQAIALVKEALRRYPGSLCSRAALRCVRSLFTAKVANT